jgi:uncharacterized membrane protein
MRKYFFTGLAILLPVVLTLLAIRFLFDLFTTPFVPLVSKVLAWIQIHLPFEIPESLNAFFSRLLALIMLILFVFLSGLITRLFLIRHLLKGMHVLMERIPLMKTVFKVSRDVFSAIFAQDGKKAFQRPVLIPFPKPPDLCLAFVAGQVPEECQRKIDTPLVSVFAPTAPHPISGFLFLVAQDQIRDIEMTNEDAVKFLVSCGVVTPLRKPTPP